MMRRRVVPVFLFVAVLFAPLLVSADSDLRPSGESYFRQYEEISGSVFDEAFGEFQTRARDKYVFGAESSPDFSEWLKLRGAVGFDRVVTQRLVSGGVDYVEGLGFVREVEVRYESPLGQRAGNFGFGALGSLRESADDVVVWELRGFVGEDDVAGANVGAAYRRLVSDDFLAGVNLFLDYERGGGTRADDVADESFWRWSAGVEATGRHLDFSANRYWAISDAVMATVGGEVFRVYSADGWDAELRGRLPLRYPVAFRFLDSAEVAARYYVWEGDGDGTGGGDADVSGARYRFGFVPLPQLRFGVEYDDGDDTRVGGGGKNFGYYINFRHRLGSASELVSRDDGADVWSRRFDPVRREHQQYIMRTQATVMNYSAEKFLSDFSAGGVVLTLSSYFPTVANYSYAVVSANPPGWTNSVSVDTNTGVVTDSGAKNATSGGTVYFSVSDSAGGVSLEFTVFFRDLSLAVSNADADDKVRFFFSDLSAGDVLTVSVGGTATSLTYAIESATPSSWRGLLSINKDSGVVNYTGGATENGEVVFSVTDNDTGAAVLLTVRFGGLSFADVSLTVHSLQASATVTTLMASGGSGAVVYEAVSFNPMNASVSLMVVGDKLIDNGLAAGGVATATVMVAATDGAGFVATAAVVVEVLDALSIAGSVDVLITPGNAGMPVATLTAMGGDGVYSYAFVSTNPPDWQAASLVLTASVVSDAGAAAGGAAMATAVFSATDGIGAMTVFVTAYIEVVESATFVSDNFTLTLTPGDTGALLTLSVLVGGGSHVFATASSTPGTFANLLMVTENANSNFVVSDNGAVAGGDATGMVVYSLADSGNTDFATVHIVVYDDITFTADEVTVTINSDDAGDNIQTITAMGGDGDYTYALESIMPASFSDSLAINNIGGEGVISDSGAATQGALTVSAVYSATDGLGDVAMASVEIVVLADVGFVADDLTITVASTDSGAMVLTLTATGGDRSYTYAAVSGNPSGWENSLAIGNSNGIITDAGAAANRAATASVVFTATDGSGLVASATVEVIAVADLVVSAVDITVSLNSGSVGDVVLTLTASGGVAPLSYAVVSTNPAAWMSGGLLAVNNGVVTHNNLATAVGDGTVVFAVTDALGMVVSAAVNFNYTAIKFSVREQHAAVVFNNRIYVIGGVGSASAADRRNDVWSSADGLNWVQETAAAGFPVRQGHAAVVLGGKIYLIGGSAGSGVLDRSADVWSSEDGVTWTSENSSAAFGGRFAHQAAVLGGTMYVAGGQNSSFSRMNDVWSSEDGAAWTVENSGVGFAAREFFAMTTLNNSLFIIGGDGGSNRRDVWSSADGATWTRDTNAAGFSARSFHSAVALGSEMFVIAGYDGSNKNDVWSSTDGTTWTEETSAAAFSRRRSHAAVAFNGRIYVLGGRDGSTRLNDVWSSADGVTWTQH